MKYSSSNIPPIDLTDSQASNPVHMSMLNVVDSTRGKIADFAKVGFYIADTNQVPDPSTGKMVDLHSAHGDSVFEQCFGIPAYLQEMARKSGKFMYTPESLGKACFNTSAAAHIVGLGDMFPEHEHHPVSRYMQVATSLVPIPYAHCRYSRLTNKAVSYLMSLDRPKMCLVYQYLAELDMLAKESPRGTYEEILVFNLNGKPTAVYFTVRRGFFMAIRYIQNSPSGDFSWDSVDSPVDQSRRADTGFSEGFSEELPFDIRSFLVNLWAAKAANTFETAREPSENRQSMQALTGQVKTDFSTYNYVRITPEGEKAYDESREVISQARGDCEYRKSVWFSRAYYAARGPEKKITLCKASIHHRKCAEVTGDERPTMYT